MAQAQTARSPVKRDSRVAGEGHELPASTAGLPHEFDAHSASRISHLLVLPVANS